MNFAEQLINWRNGHIGILRCENHVKSVINSKISGLISELKRHTPENAFGISSFPTKVFTNNLINTMKNTYNKDIDSSSIEQLILDNFSGQKNIFVLPDPCIEDTLLIFLCPTLPCIVELIHSLTEKWFNKIVLPEFEARYKNSNLTHLSFTWHFNTTFSYSPLLKVCEKFGYEANESETLISNKISDLAKSNGLIYDINSENFPTKVGRNNRFILKI